jgi:predicted amidophosphoribosyltransferase
MLPLHWFLITPCGLCGAALGEPWGASTTACPDCQERLCLPEAGLIGQDPLPWWGAGRYEGPLRQLLLHLRRHPRPEAVAALCGGVARGLASATERHERPLLVPIPSWKRQANPLPGLLCHALQRHPQLGRADLLERSRPVLGQHHLGRALRLANQAGAFHCLRPPAPGEAHRRPVLIVDDILTSGATVSSAATALRQSGWRVRGVVCLARTPRSRAEGGDLRSDSRFGDGPG